MDDLEAVLRLQAKYHIDDIAPEDKDDGFYSTRLTARQMESLMSRERGLAVAVDGGRLVGYAMAASWKYWSFLPTYAHFISKLRYYSFKKQTLSICNTYQYGPICLEKDVRGTGVFEKLFFYSLHSMVPHYPIMAAFIHKLNPRAYAAHAFKIGMTPIGEIKYENNSYYWLACSTAMHPPSGSSVK